MSIQRTQGKHIPIRETQEKKYNNIWEKHDNTNWTTCVHVLRFWGKKPIQSCILLLFALF